MKNTMLHMKLNSAVSVFAVAAAFSVLLSPSNALAGICFLPDCPVSGTMQGDINININSDGSSGTNTCGYTCYRCCSDECSRGSKNYSGSLCRYDGMRFDLPLLQHLLPQRKHFLFRFGCFL